MYAASKTTNKETISADRESSPPGPLLEGFPSDLPPNHRAGASSSIPEQPESGTTYLFKEGQEHICLINYEVDDDIDFVEEAEDKV